MGPALLVVRTRVPAGLPVPEVYKRLQLRAVPSEVRQKRKGILLILSLYAVRDRKRVWNIGRNLVSRNVILLIVNNDAASAVMGDAGAPYHLVLGERAGALV